jgi:hypothetical protein
MNKSQMIDKYEKIETQIVVLAALIIIVLISASLIALSLQQSLAQVSNQTTFEFEKPINDLSFEIDNVTFSHHTASVNGIKMHYVIGGEGDPVVLLHGWPQT